MRFLPVFIGFMTLTPAFSQPNPGMTQTTRDRINLSNLAIPNTGVLFGFEGEPGRTVGDIYLDSTWQAGNVKFYGRLTPSTDSLAGVPVRLDLMTNTVEIRAGARDVRVAKAPTVRYVDLNNRLGGNSRFINVREYRGEADGLSGFFEHLSAGRLDLLAHPTVYVRRSTYNPALNTGSKDEEIRKKTDWYIARDGRAVRFTPGRKALLELMADRKEAMETFLKSAAPDLKTRTGLLATVRHYNSLKE